MGIKSLLDGYGRFKKNEYKHQKELYLQLEKEGQSPKVLFISCCDSRCDPSIITDASPGELFMVRNVANLVPKYKVDGNKHGTSAAIEFAVRNLEVEHIIVMGHAQCGGVKFLLESAGKDIEDDFLTSWMETATEACDHIISIGNQDKKVDLQLALEYETVRLSLRNLMTFDWIRERVIADTLQLHGWYFGVAKGELHRLDPVTSQFKLVEYE